MAIDRKEIVDAALLLLDEVGIDKLSTRALSARLGVAQPALYWHFRNKEDLLDALNDEIIARHHKRRAPKPRETWDAFTLATALSFRQALLAVRDGARINAGTRPAASQFADAERQLKLYVDAGFTLDEAMQISITVARYVVGFVLEEQAEKARDATDGDFTPDQLDAHLAPYPLLREAISPLIRTGALNSEVVFRGGLEFLIAGFRSRLVPGKAQ